MSEIGLIVSWGKENMPADKKKTEQSQQHFDLADVSVLAELFEVVLYDVVRRSQMVSASSLKQEEAVAMDKQSAAFLSAVLAGKNDQFIAKPYWTGDPLASYLRIYMKERFEKVGVSENDLADTRGVLQAAAFEFVCDVYSLLKKYAKRQNADGFGNEGKRLCRMWAERMLGLKESDPVLFLE